MEKIPKLNKHRAFDKAVVPGKNKKIINVDPSFFPDYRLVLLICIHISFSHA